MCAVHFAESTSANSLATSQTGMQPTQEAGVCYVCDCLCAQGRSLSSQDVVALPVGTADNRVAQTTSG